MPIITGPPCPVATAGAARRPTAGSRALMPLRELLFSWHRNRVKRVFAVDTAPRGGRSRAGTRRADDFVGAHGVSFLTVV